MKKFIFLFLSGVLLFPFATNAQRSNVFGLHASPAVSWISTSTRGLQSNGSKLNFHYGLNGEFGINESTHYYFGTGVDFISGGGELEYNAVVDISDSLFPSTATATYKMNYLQVPLTLKLRTEEIGYSVVTGEFGLGLGARIRSRVDRTSNFNDGISDKTILEEDADASAETNFFRLGLILGLGYEHNITGDTFVRFDITYNQSFNSFVKGKSYEYDETTGETELSSLGPNGEPQGPDLKAFSRFLQFGFGINF